MKIDPRLRARLSAAVETAGGAKEFSALCGINASNISRYLRGLIRNISDDNWEKLAPFLETENTNAVPRTAGTVNNTPELREFLKKAMADKGVGSVDELRRLAGYDSASTIRRLLAGELNWFPDVLSAVFDALGVERSAAPLSDEERDMLAPAGIYSDGAMLVRPVPVVAWANATSHLDDMLSSGNTMCRWDVENTETVPVPASDSRDVRAFRVHGVSMDPKIIDDDIVLVSQVPSLECINDNKIVVVKYFDGAAQCDNVVCKRFRRQPDGSILLTSDNPEGSIIPLAAENIRWIGVVIRKISDL